MPTPQNGQTHSNNLSAIYQQIVCVFDHFVGLAIKGLKKGKIEENGSVFEKVRNSKSILFNHT